MKKIQKAQSIFTILIAFVCLMFGAELALGMVQDTSHTNDKCPDGSRRDPKLGCRQTTKQNDIRKDRRDLNKDRKDSRKDRRDLNKDRKDSRKDRRDLNKDRKDSGKD